MEIRVKAQASHSIIKDITVSGPSGISKHSAGKNEFVITWTPTADDVGEYFSVCFAVESARRLLLPKRKSFPGIRTKLKFFQSEMRCVMVEVKETIGKSHVICDESSMTILVEKASFPRLSEDHLRLNDPSNTDCSLTSNSTHVIGVVPLNQCGTQIEDDSYKTMTDPYLFPLEVEIGSRLFMKIEAISSLNNTELLVESCTAAPYDDPNYPKPYTIIADGCEVDPTINVYETDHKNQLLFSMEAFKFIGLHDQVYISCSVIMCEAGNPDTRCSQGCINATTSDRRSKRETEVQSGTHFVSQGPLRLKRSAENSDTSAVALNLNLVFIAGCVLAAVGLICGMIM